MKFANTVKVALAVAILIGLARAGAKAASGNELLEACEAARQTAPNNMIDSSNANYCLGFVAAILSVGPSLSQKRFCPPQDVAVGQGVTVFL